MKIRIVQGVVAAAVLSFGALAYGQTSNAIPSVETFEEMTGGASILVPGNTNGWYGDTNNTIAIATNITYAWTNLYPVATNHTMVLHFSDGSLTNQFMTYNATNNMTVDFMIQAVRSEDVPSSNLVMGSQTALFVDTNGLLNVWYGLDASGANNAWMTFTNAVLATSDWA